MRALQGWINASRQLPLTGPRFFLNHTAFCHPFLRVALVAAAGLAGTVSADAAVFWSDDYDPGMEMAPPPPPPVQPRRHRAPRHTGPKLETQIKETTKPVGPLVIAISLDRQKLKIYDANGLFAESPVSTGMRGHATPMGVFSVIQKQKWHQSNIYSGAPMPFMQRITWSGIAMHAGVLPGYPASHGCIRMPTAFAVKMYGWTRSGARVVITPGEISPSDFSHPLLAMQKTAPVAAAEPAKDTAKDATKDVAAVPKIDKAGPDQTKTVDASNTVVASTQPTTMTDAQPATPKADDKLAGVKAAAIDTKPLTTGPADIMTPDPSVKPVVSKTETSKTDAIKDVPAKVSDTATVDAAKPTDAAAPAAAADIKKDQVQPGDAAPAAAAVALPAARRGQIAAFVSRRDGKLYVRQDFAPLFDVPVTIAPSDRPLGTHVFTARADKSAPGTFRWSVVSLPVSPRRDDADDRTSRRRKSTGAIEVKATPQPDSPTEALDRLTIPADAMSRIADAMATGGSLIVSDLGIANGGETGEGTEFVVPLR